MTEINGIDESILNGFLEETRDSLAALDSLFISLEKDPSNTDLINAIFRPVHSVKGNAPFFGLMKLKTIAHDFESILAALRERKLSPSRTIFDLLLQGVDEIKAIVQRVSDRQPEVADESRFESLITQARAVLTGSGKAAQAAGNSEEIKSLPGKMRAWDLEGEKQAVIERLCGIVLTAAGSAAPPVAPSLIAPEGAPKTQAASSQSPAEPARKPEASKTMRVSEERIDTFLKFVGELVIAQDMLRYFSAKLESDGTHVSLMKELYVITNIISNLGTGLEKAIMSIRKVPVRSLFQKVPRIIRDVAASKQKEVEISVTGDEVEIDKSMLELLDAPLMHMARNAADHGIEKPDVREKSGKNRKGQVRIGCVEEDREICITVEDDGAGLNYDGLRRKAESLGLIRAGESLTQEQVVNLIFMAGVSTAAEVSDVSGRGVGMDVVKRNIESSGGSISVTSSPGKGSNFILRIPKAVTTQIMQGFVVQSGETFFVLPLERVRECWGLADDELTSIPHHGDLMDHQNQILRVLDLNMAMGIERRLRGKDGPMVVSIDFDRRDLAVIVDEVIGPRQLVLKPFDEEVNRAKLFLGGALLGDGQIALVLNLENIAASPESNGAVQ